MLYAIILSLIIVSLSVIGYYVRQFSHYTGAKTVPTVKGALPLLGHVLQFRYDMLGFIKKCRQEYGDIFKIRIFLVDMVVICNRDHQKEFFSDKESQMSLYQVLDRLYFADAFSDDTTRFLDNIKLIKSSIAVDYESFIVKIEEEAKKMIKNVQVNEDINLSDVAIKFVTRTSARCFIDVDLDNKLFDDIMEFTKTLNSIVVLTYFIPKWLIKLVLNPKLRNIRKRITSKLSDEIQKYRYDKSKSNSLIFRKCVDSELDLTNEEIGDIIVTLLYVSSENTALGLTATLTDLYMNRKYMQKLKIDLLKRKADYKQLIKESDLLDGCVMESARINIHLFSLNRHPVNRHYLGDYYIGDADSVVICGQFIHHDDNFKDADIYNPERPSREKSKILTWGAGLHLCPGKNFALYEIKMATAMFIMNYDMNIKKLPELNYFSPSAFAERVDMKVKIMKNKCRLEIINDDIYVFKSLLSNIDISKIVNDKVFDGVDLFKADNDWPVANAYPVAYYNNVYTPLSTVPGIPTVLVDLCESLGFNRDWCNSMYVNYYNSSSSMPPHKDEHVGDGVSISIGGVCVFVIDDHQLTLFPGDAIVTDFSKYVHSVPIVSRDGRISIQLRYVDRCIGLSTEEFKTILKN